MKVASGLHWLVLVILTLSVSMPWRPLHAATEGTTRKVAIVPFGLPSWGTDRDWISEGFPYVLALRLQHFPQVKTTVLPRSMISGPEGLPNVLDSTEVSKMLDRLQPQGYEAVIFGNLAPLESTLRAEIHVWTTRSDRHVSKTQEQAAERDPDGLGIKIAGFVMSALQLPVSEAEGRRALERYTASAEAFERFARALPLADLADDEEEVAQAVSLFKEAVKLDGRFSMAWRQQGDFLFRRGHFPAAAEAYQAVLSLGRRSATVYRLLGNAYFAQHDAPRALDAYKRALQHDARDYQLLLDLGLAYASVKDYENATKTFLRALESKPDDPLAFANLGVVYLLQGNFAAATASLRRAQLAHGADPILTYNLGLSLLFEGAYDQARDQFERALQLKPDYTAAAYQLALIYERFDAVQAVGRWRKYLELARGKPEEQLWLTWAEEHFQRLQQPSPR
jgi:tetratricopeptide (TPR) repeat protein